MNVERIRDFVNTTWDASILPALEAYIRIPNQSPAFDPQWKAHGHMDRATDLIERWMREQGIEGMKLERIEAPGRTPILFAEIPGEGEDTVLLYGHLDKQPPMLPWDEGLGPWEPVIRDGKLYGRGGADDGYAAFASLTAIRALKREGIPHARCVVLIEACEESGSYDLPHYIDLLADRIGTPSLVVCLDSGCATYDQLWSTTSLRGLVGGTLSVKILSAGVHSGEATGVVASTFRIARLLLSRIEDAETGEILLPELHTEIPSQRREQATDMAAVLGDEIPHHYPFVSGARPVVADPAEMLLARTWRPTLAVTGANGLPPIESAGNVLRPKTELKLSIRIPPGVDPERAQAAVKTALEKDPPYGAEVRFEGEAAAAGWAAPPLAPWLERAAREASEVYFGKPACYMGEGGTIPFMAMLGRKFPDAQFMITGLLGPGSNAHGPNEFLMISTAKNLTSAVSHVLACHAQRGATHGR